MDFDQGKSVSAYWAQLQANGFVSIRGLLTPQDVTRLEDAAKKLESAFPHGFLSEGVYSHRAPVVRTEPPKSTDHAPTVVFPHAGFLDPELLLPLRYPLLQQMIARTVGEDFYLSNTWYQIVPPNTGRLAYHKDPRGSVSITVLLDDIAGKCGSTCLVPGTHLNTPPPRFCMSDIQSEHPNEVDLTGLRGDVIFFSPETWHARAQNRSEKSSRRLFFNFNSRSSNETTSWEGVVSPDQVLRASESLPAEFGGMFRIDKELSRTLASRGASSALLRSTHDKLFADLAYCRSIYGRPVSRVGDGYLLPFTTRLTESAKFNAARYLGHLKSVPTLKIAAAQLLGSARYKQLSNLRRSLAASRSSV